jgi:hypothetical protein
MESGQVWLMSLYLWRKMCCSTNYFLVRMRELFKRFVSLVVSTVKIFKMEIFQLRLCRVMNFVEIVETHRDCWNLSRRIEIQQICWDASRFVEKSQHYRDLLMVKMMESLDGLRNLDRKMQKSTHLSIKIETNCPETQKFYNLDEFLDLDRHFLVWTLMFLNCRDALFENVEIFSTVETNSLTMSRLRLTIETNLDPQA